jgi:8-hydroxy-5-deazaflavin:NADPH oxidoreductase
MTQEALDKGTGCHGSDLSAGHETGARLQHRGCRLSARRSPTHAAANGFGVPLAADDKQALKVAAQLVRDAGFEPVIVGGLSTAQSFDTGHGIHGTMTASEVRAALGIK